MKTTYSLPEHHVHVRKALPPDIRETLLESTRSEWNTHPRFHGKANFFMSIHRDLINGAASLSRVLTQLLDLPDSDIAEALTASRLLPESNQLIAFAHHHHEIEDHGYFPEFTRLYPSLGHALALLDHDHTMLNEALDVTSEALNALNEKRPFRDDIASLYQRSRTLEDILKRHIWDEEEIIIPILLQHY